jgi:hypothetical protein
MQHAGIMQGNGTIQTSINNDPVNNGVINPGDSIGQLTIDGDLTQTANGVINFELANLNSFDRLAITDDVTFGGEISVWNLGYIPVNGDRFIVATFDDRFNDSKFSSISTRGFSSGVHFNAIYNPHDLTLIAAVPEPENWAMFLAGLGLMGAFIRRRT